ncbi:MAG: polyribonucleotide nucleotidyltransferase, partial [Candidatus Shikimatogenerans sp. JK-2022]|nr:polyribonucleotide nucleotidyltransferase [Candidatus Shikimatogenerans bostrichidophilus]
MYEIQIMITLLSYDTKVLPDSLVGLAASSSLLISGIPFLYPVSQIRIAKIKDKIIINPSINQKHKSNINLIIGGTLKSIIMIEGEMKEISNKEFYKILKYSHSIIKKHIKEQLIFFKKTKKNKNKKIKKIKKIKNIKLKKKIKNISYKFIKRIFKNYRKKKKRKHQIEILLEIIKKKINNLDY